MRNAGPVRAGERSLRTGCKALVSASRAGGEGSRRLVTTRAGGEPEPMAGLFPAELDALLLDIEALVSASRAGGEGTRRAFAGLEPAEAGFFSEALLLDVAPVEARLNIEAAEKRAARTLALRASCRSQFTRRSQLTKITLKCAEIGGYKTLY